MLLLDRDFVRRHLSVQACIPLMKQAMSELSAGTTIQPLRSVLHLDEGRAFGVMPGAMAKGGAVFGAKLVSVYPENFAKGRPSHQGAITVFDPEDGQLVALVEASEVTRIRTGCASAAATDVLARKDATVLAVMGYGDQAISHIEAIAAIRPLQQVRLWGRKRERAEDLATRMADTGLSFAVCDTPAEAARGADIICTTTASLTPLLSRADVAEGTHINAVGSSYAGPYEIAPDLVQAARFIADYRPGVLAQGAEYLVAKDQGLIDEDHVVGEIGQVFLNQLEGRTGDDQITIYKSLGHVVQDLACAAWLVEQARATGEGTVVPF